MMSLDRIRELLKLMKDHDLVELELTEKDFGVKLKKPSAPAAPVVLHAPHAAHAPHPAHPPAAAGAHAAAKPAGADADLVPIKSPIVGTFYRAPSPDSQPFVQVGGKVVKDTVVCIVEAMKIMNEIKAGMAGTVEKLLVENGEAVEFGQPLFLVRP
jgi:acetyl-CoA carboxylase biotin carboxyl carrier protein